jgi:predicted short-subunit dehydrogenase-like oxidoreductase (DUF2520 family)
MQVRMRLWLHEAVVAHFNIAMTPLVRCSRVVVVESPLSSRSRHWRNFLLMQCAKCDGSLFG